MVAIFTPEKLANTTNWMFLFVFSFRELVAKLTITSLDKGFAQDSILLHLG